MTAQDIIARLFVSGKPLAAARVQKAQGLALRSKVEWSAVLAALTPDQVAALDPA